MRSVINLQDAMHGLRRMQKSVEKDCVTGRKRRQSRSNLLWPIYVSDALVLSNHLFPSQWWTISDNITFPFEVALRKDNFSTCLLTRAVHLENLLSLEISSCVMGIERFTARIVTLNLIEPIMERIMEPVLWVQKKFACLH